MGRIGTPLTWKRRAFAVLEPRGMVDRLVALGVTGVVAGPFAVYSQPFGNGYTLLHLPTQVPIVSLISQGACKNAAEEFAALDMNWWTTIPEEVLGPDLQAMRNLHIRLRGASWVTVGTGREAEP
jgi:hypothetical protein